MEFIFMRHVSRRSNPGKLFLARIIQLSLAVQYTPRGIVMRIKQPFYCSVLRVNFLLFVMHLSIETPTPPTPGLCGAMWGIFMVFEGMVSPWGWGISQDLLSIFMEVHGSRGKERGGDLTRA